MREIFNVPMIVNKYYCISPYVVLLANQFKPKIVGRNLKIMFEKGKMTRRWDNYIQKNADLIFSDIITIDDFFDSDDSLEALEV